MYREIAISLFVCSCMSTADETTGQTQQDIINGQLVTTNDHGVVMLTTSEGLCTGTMVNHFWVLTAKHCIDGIAQTGVTASLDGVMRTSQAIVPHPSQDVALVILSSAMPINGASSGFSLPVHPGTNQSLVGQTLDCWGFGRNTFDGGSGVLRHAPIEVVFNTLDGKLIYSDNASDQIQWKGDSGGTCFTTAGQLSITGVNSTASFSGTDVTAATQIGPEFYRGWLLSLPFNEGAPLVADFDGDHRGDLVFAWNADPGLVIQSAKLAPGLPAPRGIDRLPDGVDLWSEGPPLVGDFNGDGRDDLAFARLSNGALQIRTKMSNGNGSYTPFTQQFTEGAELWNRSPPLVGDFNGDGKTDIAFAWFVEEGIGLQIRTKLSNGDGTYATVVQTLGDDDVIWNRSDPLVGDFNGDGKTDIAFAWRATAGLRIHTKQSNGNGTYSAFALQLDDGAALWNKGPPLVGDMNGDGKDDIVFAWYAGDGVGLQIRTKLSFGNGKYRAFTDQLTDGDGIWNRGQPMIGDVNGDGRDDLVFAWFTGASTGMQIRSKLSTTAGDGTFTAVAQNAFDDDFVWNRGGPKLTDTDGDGRADLVFPCERNGRLVLRVKRGLAAALTSSDTAL